MISNSPQGQRVTSLTLNESPVEKSIISQLPFPTESIDFVEKMNSLNAQVYRLSSELEYYKKEAFNKQKNSYFNTTQSNRDTNKSGTSQNQQGRVTELTMENQKLRYENEDHKNVIKKISEELRMKKRQSQVGEEQLLSECRRLQIENKQLREENMRYSKQNHEMQYNLQDLQLINKRNQEILQIQKKQLEIKLKEPTNDLRRRNLQLQNRITELTEELGDYMKEIDSLQSENDKLRKENVIDRQKRSSRRSQEHLAVNEGSRSRYSVIINNSHSRATEMEYFDQQRLNLKLAEKNKEYQLLYHKFQNLENDYHNQQEINHQLERERRLLEEKISNFEIHTEGDEVVGELQTKLVLMSTEVMRLGQLSRTKVQQTKELTIKIKELILQNQHLEKDLIQQKRVVFNYKEELRLMELRLQEQNIAESRLSKQHDKQGRDKTSTLLKEIERLTNLKRQNLEALNNAEIKNAILQQKNSRLSKQNEELERQLKMLSNSADKNKDNTTKILNYEAEVNYYKESSTAQKEEIRRMDNKIHEIRSDIDRVSRQKQEYRLMSMTMQDRVTSLQEEIRRIHLKLDDKEMQARQLNHEYEEKLIIKNNQLRKIEEKFSFIQKENQRNSKYRSQLPKLEELIKQIQRLEKIELELKLQISNYEEKLALLAQQNERLNFMTQNLHNTTSTMEKLKPEIEQKDKRIRELSKEIDTLTLRQKRCRQQNENLREKLRGNIVNERQSDSLQFKNRQLRDEFDVLKTQLSVRQEEFRNLNQRYQRQSNEKYKLLMKNEELNSKISTNSFGNDKQFVNKDYYERQLEKYIQQNKNDKLEIHELQESLSEHENIYSTLSNEILRLNEVVTKSTEKISSYKKEVDLLQHKVKTCEESLNQRKVPQFSSEKSIAEAESKTKIQICQGKIRGYEGQLQLYKQRYNNLRETNINQQSKIGILIQEKSSFEQKVNQLEFQNSIRLENFRNVEDSFKLTIMQIKSSNERLEHSMRQIQTHYINKLEAKQNECGSLRRERKQYEQRMYQLQKKLSNMEIQYGSQINQKNKFINNLNSNHNQTKQEIQYIKKIKNQYQIKIALLSQQIERLSNLKDRQTHQIEHLTNELRMNQTKFVNSMKDSSYSAQTVQALSQEIQRLNEVILKNVEVIRQNQKKFSKQQIESQDIKRQYHEFRLKYQQIQRKTYEQKESISSKIQKYEEANRELKYQLQEKAKQCQRLGERMRNIQDKGQVQTNSYMKNLTEEMKLLREGNQNLQKKLGVITKQYEQLVEQLQYYKKSKTNADQDEKMRIIGNYQATIKHMKEQNTILVNQKTKYQIECQKLNQISHDIQDRYKISEQKSRAFQDKSRRLEERLKIVQQRLRSTDDVARGTSSQKTVIEQKLISVMEEVGRLQLVIKSKQVQIDRLTHQIRQSKSRQSSTSPDKFVERKGFFVINEASQMDERSRSASGNNPQPLGRHPSNPQMIDLQHRYELLQSVNKKVTTECQCLRKKSVQYEFKINKLKEQFDLINRLIHEYREENDKLKENNKLLNIQISSQRNNNHRPGHSQFSSPQHSSVRTNSYIEVINKSPFPPSFIPNSPKSNIETFSRSENQENFVAVKSKLFQQIDRLNKVNGSLQGQVHDLRVHSSESISLKKRFQQNLGLMVILFVQIEALRMRVRQAERGL